ncbi:MAG: hypothetical protein H6741_04050 [Alphaproteobacteria bacterium]|nr:hypothetical protein [Alphaproteobacteria bacterium]MCB9791878.1 hypothetical protein [Alphaproteobacteria bacterium]
MRVLSALLLLLSSTALADDAAVVVPDASGLQVEGSAERTVEEAYSALAAGRFEEAARLFYSLAEGGAGEDAKVLEGLAWYEAGELRRAADALRDVSSPAGLNLLGLTWIDSGLQAEGMQSLERARKAGDPGVAARATHNLGVARMDLGQLKQAEALLREARTAAEGLGDAALVQRCDASLAVLAAMRGEAPGEGPGDPLDAVADALRRGAVGRAQSLIEVMRARATTRKQRVAVGLAQGAVLRAQGQPDQAAAVLTETLAEARAGALARETAQALASLGVAHALAGRQDLALTLLAEAEATARSGGYLAAAVDYGGEAALLALRQGSVDAAAAKLTELRATLAGMNHPMGQARVNELAGGVAAAQGDLEGAAAAYEEALRWHSSKGHYADAARVAVGLMSALAEHDPSAAKAARAKALTLFEQAGDPLGPAHVSLAWGLARARAKDLEGALEAFGAARDAASAVKGEHAAFVRQTAELNAAKALVALGASEDAARLAAAAGIEGAMAHNAALGEALHSYEEGLTAYEAGRYSEARRLFRAAADGFDGVGEAAYARQSRHALAWSAYNLAVALPTSEAYPFWGELIRSAQEVEDTELEARAKAAAALAARELGVGGGAAELEAAAAFAAERGLPSVAARCQAALAEESSLSLADRARAARRALALSPEDPGSAYAMYSVAVDAYNADDMDLAVALSEEVLPQAGQLEEAVREVLKAAGG